MKRIPLLPLLALAAVSAGAETLPLPRYTKLVEYIESSGTQWINTGFSPTNKNIRIEVRYRFVSLPTGTSRKYVFGESANEGKVRVQYAVGSAGNCAIGFGNVFQGVVTFDSYDTNTTHTIVCDGGVFSLDGTATDEWDLSDAPLATTDTNHPIYLFGLNVNNNSNPSTYLSSIRLYSCKIWDNGVLVRDFMPALKDWTTPCLYDAVSGTFYENAGSGSFVAGGDTTQYRDATYIESNQSAFVDTEYVPNARTELEMKFAFTTTLTNKTYVFGTYGGNGGRYMFSYGPIETGCFFGYGNVYDNAVPGLPYNTGKHIIRYVPGDGFLFDGFLVTNATCSLTTWIGTSRNLYLGALNRNNQGTLQNQCSPIRIYHCKIRENGELVRDLVPKQRKFDGKNGLYDNVTGNFYGYYGTRTDFTAFFAPAGLVIIVK